MIITAQPWHPGFHGERWADDAYIEKYLELYWHWLTATIIPNPPDLPLDWCDTSFQPGYFELLLARKEALSTAVSSVKRAEARRLAHELWMWRQWWLSKS